MYFSLIFSINRIPYIFPNQNKGIWLSTVRSYFRGEIISDIRYCNHISVNFLHDIQNQHIYPKFIFRAIGINPQVFVYYKTYKALIILQKF